MIKRIKIEGYKSFKSLDLKLSPVSVIFGPNASGKSNLSDAIYLLSRMATCKTIGEAFDGHRGYQLESFFYGDVGFEEMVKKPKLQMSFEVDVELSEVAAEAINDVIRRKRADTDSDGTKRQRVLERLLRYTLDLEMIPKEGVLRVLDEKVCAIKGSGEEKKRKAFLEKGNDKHGKEKLRLRLEGQAHPFYHDTGLDYTVLSTPLYQPHYPHLSALKEEMSRWQSYYLEPRELMREEVPLAEIRQIGPRGENLAAFLNFLSHDNSGGLKNFNLALGSALPFKAELQIDQLRAGLLSLRLSENDLWYSARLISEGTLRVIGLMAAVSPETPTTVVCYEEPENGVHPVRLKIIADLVKNAARYHSKQVILTTHSPTFADCFEDSQLFVCRKEGGESRIERLETEGPIFRGLRRERIERGLQERIAGGEYGG
jgi:predicted ATPase